MSMDGIAVQEVTKRYPSGTLANDRLSLAIQLFHPSTDH